MLPMSGDSVFALCGLLTLPRCYLPHLDMCVVKWGGPEGQRSLPKGFGEAQYPSQVASLFLCGDKDQTQGLTYVR